MLLHLKQVWHIKLVCFEAQQLQVSIDKVQAAFSVSDDQLTSTICTCRHADILTTKQTKLCSAAENVAGPHLLLCTVLRPRAASNPYLLPGGPTAANPLHAADWSIDWVRQRDPIAHTMPADCSANRPVSKTVALNDVTTAVYNMLSPATLVIQVEQLVTCVSMCCLGIRIFTFEPNDFWSQ